MENEEVMDAEARLYQKNNTDDPRDMDTQTVDTLTAGPVSEETALLGDTGKRRDSQPGSPPPPNPWYDPQFEGLPWYRRPGVCTIFFLVESVSARDCILRVSELHRLTCTDLLDHLTVLHCHSSLWRNNSYKIDSH